MRIKPFCKIWGGSMRNGTPIKNNKSLRREIWRRIHGHEPVGILTTICGNSACIEPTHICYRESPESHYNRQDHLQNIAPEPPREAPAFQIKDLKGRDVTSTFPTLAKEHATRKERDIITAFLTHAKDQDIRLCRKTFWQYAGEAIVWEPVFDLPYFVYEMLGINTNDLERERRALIELHTKQ